ncbi:MAG TPA: hypothetical protein VG917_04485 [Patescibacteria group bacterium]|nr:hypothetical protein [Patescibacteria group bacterium]
MTELDNPGAQPEEDFASLLEQYMGEEDLANSLLEKEGSNRRLGRGSNLVRKPNIYRAIKNSTVDMMDGNALGAFNSVRKILHLEMPAKVRLLAYVNLGDSALKVARGETEPAAKINWYEESCKWSDKALDLKLPDSSGQVFSAAVMQAWARNEQAEIEEDPEKRKDLLEQAYKNLHDILDSVSLINNGWEFTFHATLHKSARKAALYVNTPEDKRAWDEIWFDHARKAAEVSHRSDNSHGERVYIYWSAQAAAAIGYGEVNKDEARKWFVVADNSVTRSIDLAQDGESLRAEYGLAAFITSNLVKLSDTDEDKSQWLDKNIGWNKRMADSETNPSRRVTQLIYCLAGIDGMIKLKPEDKETWEKRKITYLELLYQTQLKIAQDFDRVKDPRRAANALIELSKTASRIRKLDKANRADWDNRSYIASSSAAEEFNKLGLMVHELKALNRGSNALDGMIQAANSDTDREKWSEERKRLSTRADELRLRMREERNLAQLIQVTTSFVQ